MFDTEFGSPRITNIRIGELFDADSTGVFCRESGDERTEFSAAYEAAAQRDLAKFQEPEPVAIRRQWKFYAACV
ncbi:MAG: hypothetical protein U0105_22540 [Candidatus Obscuribacterales bacterium]